MVKIKSLEFKQELNKNIAITYMGEYAIWWDLYENEYVWVYLDNLGGKLSYGKSGVNLEDAIRDCNQHNSENVGDFWLIMLNMMNLKKWIIAMRIAVIKLEKNNDDVLRESKIQWTGKNLKEIIKFAKDVEQFLWLDRVDEGIWLVSGG